MDDQNQCLAPTAEKLSYLQLSQLLLPDWLKKLLFATGSTWVSRQWSRAERLQLAVDLSQWNVERGTGGPFGAAIFDAVSGELVSVGLNRVEPLKDATAHAEVIAIRLANSKVESFCLSDQGLQLELYSSAQPCCMCTGAILWSGLHGVYYAAPKESVERFGFDEGPTPTLASIYEYGIVFEGVPGELQHKAEAVLQQYQRSGRPIYNGKVR